MKNSARFSAAIAALALALVAGSVQPAIAKGYVEDMDNVPAGSSLVGIWEASTYHNDSLRMSQRFASNGKRVQGLCAEGLGLGDCDFKTSGADFFGKHVLPPCESAAQENCIVGVAFSRDGEKYEAAKYVRSIQGPTVAAVPDQGLPAGSTLSLWEAPGFENSGGKASYVVSTTASYRWDGRLNSFVANAFDAAVIPYSVVSGNYFPSRVSVNQTPDGETLVGNGSFGNTYCVWTDTGACGQIEDFVGELQVELQVRLSNDIAGWFQGRLRDPAIAVENFSAKNNLITVRAKPVTIARFGVLANKENTSDATVQALSQRLGRSGKNWFEGQSLRGTEAIRPVAFELLETFKQIAKDTAIATSTTWNFSSVLYAGGNPCFADKARLLGVVTTNATVYNGQVPEFNGGSLNYKVAGLHYAPDGKTLNEGSYDLVMRSDVARCLYGFSKAPISATVSVIGEGGENKVATTVVNEKDGWLKLAAYGFTFSSPTISVKISQAKAPAKKTTITCVKGKLTKKVTAVGPKCPAGYKKK